VTPYHVHVKEGKCNLQGLLRPFLRCEVMKSHDQYLLTEYIILNIPHPRRFVPSPSAIRFTMRFLLGDIYNVHGSADELEHPLTGWEWLRLFRLVRRWALFDLGLALTALGSCAPFFVGHCKQHLPQF
jgi:hypothetical protein